MTAKDLAVRAGPPVSSLPWRNVITALAAGAAVALVAVSAMGRRSGAHLNPALTFGLWLQRTVSSADLAGYCAAQLATGLTKYPTTPAAATESGSARRARH